MEALQKVSFCGFRHAHLADQLGAPEMEQVLSSREAYRVQEIVGNEGRRLQFLDRRDRLP